MKRCIRITGDGARLTLSNLGTMEGIDEIDLSGTDINDAEDIQEVMETIEAFAESWELEATTEIQRLSVIAPDDAELAEVCDDTEEKPLPLDTLTLRNRPLNPVETLLANAQPGDIVYLRRETGKAEWELCYDTEEVNGEVAVDYIDCDAMNLDPYTLLREPYFDYLCDTIVPESLRVGDTPAQLEHILFEPRVIYGELYRVIEDPETWDKYLERIELPGHYFLAEEVESEELIDETD